MIKILFLSANPDQTDTLKLDAEMRTIEDGLRKTEFRDHFETKNCAAVHYRDLQALLLQHKPDIVHFSGHGSTAGEIILEGDEGKVHPVSAHALGALFSALKDNIRCVVLNACYSETQAGAIAEYIDVVVSINGTISDSAATAFSKAFYDALGYGKGLQAAFKLGCNQIEIANLTEEDKPRLLAQRCEPAKLFLLSHDAGERALPHRPRSTPSEPVLPPAIGEETSGSNPFLYGSAVPPAQFIRREAALKKIQMHVGHNDSLQSLSIVANRRMGKTSLLNYVGKEPQRVFSSNHQYLTVYVDAMEARARKIPDFVRILRRGITSKLGRELWPEKHDGNLTVLHEAFEDLANQNMRLILLLDEWEKVMKSELDALLMELRASGSMAYIGMITATAHPLSSLETAGGLVSKFSNIFSEHCLGNLPRAEWQKLIRNAYAHSGQVPEQSDYDLVGELAGGHPYLTQLAGSLIWQGRQERWNSAQIHAEFTSMAKPIFSNLWQQLSKEQIGAIKGAMGLKSDVLLGGNVVAELKTRGVLAESGEVFCQPFADYVFTEVR